MSALLLLLAMGAAFAVALGLTAHLAGARARLRWLDHPGERSLHVRPTPRTGGVAIVAGVAAGCLLAVRVPDIPVGLVWVGVAAGLVAAVSLLDDRGGIGVLPRLLSHTLAAALVLAAGLVPSVLAAPGLVWAPPGPVAWGLAMLFLVWMANLYNFMDGMDGFAGGMAVFGFGCMALLGWHEDAFGFAVLNAVVASAAAGFLLFNLPPARIFMGDTGASTLGLLAGAAMLWADRDGIFPLWIGVLVFSPFIVDATLTLVAGIVARERVWQPHRRHCYQRLVRRGWSHRRTVLAEYALMFLAGATALWWVRSGGAGGSGWILGAWTMIYAIIFLWVLRSDRR